MIVRLISRARLASWLGRTTTRGALTSFSTLQRSLLGLSPLNFNTQKCHDLLHDVMTSSEPLGTPAFSHLRSLDLSTVNDLLSITQRYFPEALDRVLCARSVLRIGNVVPQCNPRGWVRAMLTASSGLDENDGARRTAIVQIVGLITSGASGHLEDSIVSEFNDNDLVRIVVAISPHIHDNPSLAATSKEIISRYCTVG